MLGDDHNGLGLIKALNDQIDDFVGNDIDQKRIQRDAPIVLHDTGNGEDENVECQNDLAHGISKFVIDDDRHDFTAVHPPTSSDDQTNANSQDHSPYNDNGEHIAFVGLQFVIVNEILKERECQAEKDDCCAHSEDELTANISIGQYDKRKCHDGYKILQIAILKKNAVENHRQADRPPIVELVGLEKDFNRKSCDKSSDEDKKKIEKKL